MTWVNEMKVHLKMEYNNVEEFPWDSEDQKKGYLNLVQYLRKVHGGSKNAVDSTAAYFIQKDHESAEYYTTLIGTQVHNLQNDIFKVQQDLRQALSTIESLTMCVKSQQLALQSLIPGLKDASKE